MKRISWILSILYLKIGWFACVSIWAGGPMLVFNNKPVVWPSSIGVVVYTLDQGDLGSISNYNAKTMVNTAFNEWQSITNSWLRFSASSSPLPQDVNGNNYQQVMSQISVNINPIIFDNDGSILELLVGTGSKENMLGLSSIQSSGNQITRAQEIYNGYFIKKNRWTQQDYLSTVIHELGHLCGLDHSQFHRDLAYNNVGGDDIYVPIMFPTSTDDEASRIHLTFDDKIALGNLYPTAYHLNSTGSITGTVRRGSTELPGVNVVVSEAKDPLAKTASTVTGTFRSSSGQYEVAGLPVGDYTVMVEPIDSSFTGASSVGQYSQTSSGKSFRVPVRSEYYNTGEQTAEGRSQASSVTVRILNKTSSIDFQVETAVALTDEDNALVLPLGFSATGAAQAGYYSLYNYLLCPTGNEGYIEMNITFNKSMNAAVDVYRETTKLYSVSRMTNIITIGFGAGGNVPLENARYFIKIANREVKGSADMTFTISTAVQVLSTPTPTPSFTATPTSTATAVPTPSHTSTPTYTPTPSHTPVPSPTPTLTFSPTPSPTPIIVPVKEWREH